MSVAERKIDGQRYRPDIDGLRAIAVLAVVFFHVGFAPFSGGYVGVDVFFVISGFLITRLIRAQVQAGTFSFAQFYARRARRLFPALFFTIVASFVFAALLFSPADMERFARSVVFTILSISNFLFWRESGYFDASADVKPLLHTWSLSVEEQFYLVWPATLVMVLWAGRRLAMRGQGLASVCAAPAFMIAVGLLSLALTELCLRYSAPAAFYLLPFRVSEFAIGGLMVWLVAMRSKREAYLLEPLVLVGVALIAWPVFAYTEDTVFPGVTALPPCIGTAILIYAGTAKRLGHLLSNRLTVGIGLISYSLYLVHWPLIVFYQYWVFRPFVFVEQVMIVAASIALATGMYFFVEIPFRRAASRPGAWSPARFGLACVCLATLAIVPAASAWRGEGWPNRMPEGIRDTIANLGKKRSQTWKMVRPMRRNSHFANGKINVLVIGDSHGKDLSNALQFANKKLNGRLDIAYRLIKAKCQPFDGPRPVTADLTETEIYSCNSEVRKLIASRAVSDADYILFSVRWGPLGVEKIAGTIDALREQTDAEIVLLGRTVEFDDVPTLLTKYRQAEGFDRFLATHRVDLSVLNARLEKVARQQNVRYLSKEPLICPSENTCDALDEDGRILFYDYGHWTPEGARFFGQRMLDIGYFDFLKNKQDRRSDIR